MKRLFLCIAISLLLGCTSLSNMDIDPYGADPCLRVCQLRELISSGQAALELWVLSSEVSGTPEAEVTKKVREISHYLEILDIHLEHWEKKCDDGR